MNASKVVKFLKSPVGHFFVGLVSREIAIGATALGGSIAKRLIRSTLELREATQSLVTEVKAELKQKPGQLSGATAAADAANGS